jgi:hypothetical protein
MKMNRKPNKHRITAIGAPPFRYPKGTRKLLTPEQKRDLLMQYQTKLAQWMGVEYE